MANVNSRNFQSVMTNALAIQPLYFILHGLQITFDRGVPPRNLNPDFVFYNIAIGIPVILTISLSALLYKRDQLSPFIKIVLYVLMIANVIALMNFIRLGASLLVPVPLISIGITVGYLRKFDPDLNIEPIFQIPKVDIVMTEQELVMYIRGRITEIVLGYIYFIVNWFVFFLGFRPGPLLIG